jgi:hypothetical protein
MMVASKSKAVMNLSELHQYWLDRLRAEAAAISDSARSARAEMQLANIEFAFGLQDAGQATLVRCIQQLQFLHPGEWTSSVVRAAELCDNRETRRLLEPELNRGLAWLADPEIAKYQGGLRDCVHHVAIHTGRADVALSLVEDEWPGKAARRLVDECRIAGLFENAGELRRLLPLARNEIKAAAAGPTDLRNAVGYQLIPAYVRSGLLDEAAELAEESDFPLGATDELISALFRAKHQSAYIRICDGLLASRINQFSSKTDNHHHASTAVRDCTELIRGLGDVERYKKAVRQFHEAVVTWKPSHDWIACAVKCDLAVLHQRSGNAQISSDYLTTAKRLFDGKEPAVPTTRGSRSLMASILSSAHRDVGNIELALRYARRISSAPERQLLLTSALIAGGSNADAEAEMVKLDSPERRMMLIGNSLQISLR